MVDVTLQIILEPSTHDLSSNPNKDAARWRRGDVFEVHLSSDVATLINDEWHISDSPLAHTVFGYVHVIGVPTDLTLRIRDVLTSTSGEMRSFIQDDPITGVPVDDPVSDYWRIRKWRIPMSILPGNLRNKLLADREINVPWRQAKQKIRRKLTSIRLDVSLDDENTELTDEDLN